MRRIKWIIVLSMLMLATTSLYSARIKDITKIAGVRDNQLIGYGLVVGLDGTGDQTNQTPFTDQTFRNMLMQFGIRVPEGREGQLRNVAAVAVSATLPPFARIGQKIDVHVLSLGNATSLRGGELLMVPLRGADGKVYAMSQGSVIVSGFGAQGSDGSKVIVNSTSSGSIPDGATVENTIDTPFVQNGNVTFELLQPDFTSALRIQDAINHEYGHKVARAIDASSVEVRLSNLINQNDHKANKNEYMRDEYTRDDDKGDIPATAESRRLEESKRLESAYVPEISRMQNLTLNPADVGARVSVNSRTGTIVIGQNVTVMPVAVSHGNLSVIITEVPFVSQPNALSPRGATVTGTASNVNVIQQNERAFVFSPGPSLNDLVDAINKVGAAPGDLISILEAIKAAGALNADLEVM